MTASYTAAEQITVLDASIHITDLEVRGTDIAEFYRNTPEQERLTVLTKAIEVGTFCLQRGQTAQDAEFVKRKVGELLLSVEAAVTDIPTRTEIALISKLGTDDGQALAPVRLLLNSVSDVASARVNEVKTLLTNDLDPSRSTSTIGAALQKLRDLLDPQRNDSVQAEIQTAVRQVTSKDGNLAVTVKSVVEASLQGMRDEVSRLTAAVSGKEMVDLALQNTTEKGPVYEDEVSETLQQWAKNVGAHVCHVGGDNQPGDFVVELTTGSLTPVPLRIVVEARDRQSRYGVQRISQDLTTKMAERKADAAIYVSKTEQGLAKEVGDWAEGACEKGPWVACTDTNLATALRFLIVQMQLKKLREAAADIDAAGIQAQVAAIRTSFGRIKTINAKVTNLSDIADDISKQADELKKEVLAALASIEDALRSEKKPAAIAEGCSLGAAQGGD